MRPSFFRKNAGITALVLLAFITWLINQFPRFIEQYYSVGLYPVISRTERILLGWLPFSIGDLLYAASLIWIIIMLVKGIKVWRRKQITRQHFLRFSGKLLRICLWIYISFNWLWGFNYNRLGSAYQMQLTFSQYSNAELVQLTDSLHHKMLLYMNDSAAFDAYKKLPALTKECRNAYDQAERQFSFLNYRYSSVKPHTLYTIGNYIGFLGYLNPFTAEAQLNTTIPLVLKPAVLCHEMGHQLGYASESEANFIAFITCRQSRDPAFRYSIYYDMYGYAIGDLYIRDSAAAVQKIDSLPLKIKRDRQMVRQFFRKYKNPVSPAIDWFYDKYLKLNSQPKGRESYNQVVGWMIAYARHYGWAQL